MYITFGKNLCIRRDRYFYKNTNQVSREKYYLEHHDQHTARDILYSIHQCSFNSQSRTKNKVRQSHTKDDDDLNNNRLNCYEYFADMHGAQRMNPNVFLRSLDFFPIAPLLF